MDFHHWAHFNYPCNISVYFSKYHQQKHQKNQLGNAETLGTSARTPKQEGDGRIAQFMKIIAIVGFGFSGRLALHHLLKTIDKNSRILIFDKEEKNSLGPAFSGFSPHYILNVPAKNMSAFSDKPNDFCEFLQKKYPKIWQKIGESGFAPRHIFGEYLEEITKRDLENCDKNLVSFVKEEVVKIEEEFSLTTKNGRVYQANEIMLATSFRQSDLTLNISGKNIVKKLWDKEAISFFHQENLTDEKICLIGCGLSAIDVITSLKKKNFSGKIIAISRRGNFPKKHFVSNNPKFEEIFSVEDARKGVLFLCQKTRKFLHSNSQFDLCGAVDAIRPNIKKIWQNFDQRNKKIFLKHLWPYWNIFRHRAPDSSIDIIEKMIAEKQLEILKINQIQKGKKLKFDYVVNCLGFELRAEKYSLLQQMIDSALLNKDILLAQSNHSKIHLLGGMNIGRDFECTAVPDLRENVEEEVKKLR